MNGTPGLIAILVICRRELVRFARQPARIAAAIGTPLLLLVFLGSGFAGAFRPAMLGDISYTAFLLPGVMTLTAVFTAVFASISAIEDRQAGWLQSVLVSPTPRWAVAAGRVLGGALLAWIQAAVVLAFAPLLGIAFHWQYLWVALLALALTCVAMTAMGLAFAWRSETTGGFHAVMNLVFMPMWLLSGAFFPPPQESARWLGVLMWVNPLTWCTQAIRNPLLGETWAMPLLGAAAFAVAMFAIATAMVARRGD